MHSTNYKLVLTHTYINVCRYIEKERYTCTLNVMHMLCMCYMCVSYVSHVWDVCLTCSGQVLGICLASSRVFGLGGTNKKDIGRICKNILIRQQMS